MSEMNCHSFCHLYQPDIMLTGSLLTSQIARALFNMAPEVSLGINLRFHTCCGGGGLDNAEALENELEFMIVWGAAGNTS